MFQRKTKKGKECPTALSEVINSICEILRKEEDEKLMQKNQSLLDQLVE